MASSAPMPPKRPGMVKLEVVTANKDYDGMTVVAACSNTGPELSFKEGDIVYVLSATGEKFKCRVGGKEGHVPKDILTDCSSIELPLHEAAKRVNTLDSAGNSPLFWASRCGHVDCVKVLLAANPVLNQQNKLGDTCLHGAAWGGHADALAVLMQVDGIQELVSKRNNSGQTAYDLAKSPECAALLQPKEYFQGSVGELNEDSD